MPKRLAANPGDFSSLFLRIEELMLASSGADVFEETLKLLARKLYDETGNLTLLESAEDPLFSKLSASVREQCTALLAPFTLSEAGETLDALFETLISRTSKGQKGQFFTPRYIVDFCVRLVQLQGGEAVLDPACGSGAFLNAALERGAGSVSGYDIDARAVRVAKLLMLARGADAGSIREGDGLREVPNESADIVLTNPPFAGEINDLHRLAEFELGAGRKRIERDVLFLERSIKALRPGGKIAIVLPHSKFAGKQTRYIREWLLEHAQVLAVIGLGRNTFLPHTHQKANVLLARRRTQPRNGRRPAVFFAQSRIDAKDSRGRPSGSSDLDLVLEAYTLRQADEAQLDENLTLAPERNTGAAAPARAACIGDVAKNTSTYCKPGEPGPFVVVDTTHALDGFISTRPLETVKVLRSNKKRLQAGDVIVSRLRPYLRQVAYVDAELLQRFPGAQLCCSTEFYVLRTDRDEDAAFLVPFLLTSEIQVLLARSQEGGHHPRVPCGVVTNIALSAGLLRARHPLSTEFARVVAAFREVERARELLVRRSATPAQ
ncbi:MAG: class I SAM-dependent DNA methyltransferase [Candidatus Baltobacteraceae bacterium]